MEKRGPERIQKSCRRLYFLMSDLFSSPLSPGPAVGYNSIVPVVESTVSEDSYRQEHKCSRGLCWGIDMKHGDGLTVIHFKLEQSLLDNQIIGESKISDKVYETIKTHFPIP